MAQGRCSASVMVLGLVTVCVIFQCAVVEGTTYTVGGREGWGFQVAKWMSNKPSFRAGDYLLFRYDPIAHDVVPVNAEDYKNCRVGRSRELRSGRDRIKLNKGTNYFICSIPSHCESGMKIAVQAR